MRFVHFGSWTDRNIIFGDEIRFNEARHMLETYTTETGTKKGTKGEQNVGAELQYPKKIT